MLGLAAGGSLVYALPRWFTPETVLRRVALLSAGSGVLLCAAIIIVLGIPVAKPSGMTWHQVGTIHAALITLSLLPSYILAGIAIAALFQSFPKAFPGLYSSDLLGAGLGAVIGFWLMWQVSGPSLILLMGSLLVGSGAFFAASGGYGGLRTQLALLCALLFIASLVNESVDLVRVRHTKTNVRLEINKSKSKATKKPVEKPPQFSIQISEFAVVQGNEVVSFALR